MKKFTKILTFVPVLLLCISTLNGMGQGHGGKIPPSQSNAFNLDQVETQYLPHSDKDIPSLSEAKQGAPMWAGLSVKTEVFLGSQGTVVQWPNGDKSWLMRITSPGAPALGLVMEGADFPHNATLYLYSEYDPTQIYAVDAQDIESGFISTPAIPTETLIVEYTEKLDTEDRGFKGSFVITDLIVVYNGLETAFGTKDLGEADWCQVNINCSPEGDNWQRIKRGIARMFFKEGSYWYYCTGTLINNTNQDGTPYFLTAEHCGGSASTADRNSWQFYFNYERPGCENTGTPPTNLRVGCKLKSKGLISGGSDFQLVQLNSAPPQSWNPYYNGWDRSTTPATGGVGIHHPSGDAKKISTYTGTLVSSSPNIGGSQMAANSAWRVVWVQTPNGHGCTEGGSSGSPLFNNSGMIVGTLSGGSSYCSTPSNPDYYGKFSYHWQSNGTTDDKKLDSWLDPDNTGLTTLPGYDPYAGIIPNFAADKTVAFPDEDITFTDLSTGDEIASWSWNFGEGASPATASGQGPHTVTYFNLGYKTVSLTINGQETETKEDYILIKEPSNTILLYEQEPNTAGGSAVNSTLTEGSNYLVAENFPDLSGRIEKIAVYGIYAIHDGSAWSECTPENNISFNVALYDPSSQQPDWDNPIYDFTVGSESSTYGGWGDWTLYQWDIELPGQVDIDGEGWISVQANDPTCWFLWINSTQGDGYAYQFTGDKEYRSEHLSLDGSAKSALNYDVALQLWARTSMAKITSFNFIEDVVENVTITPVQNHEGEVLVEVEFGTDVTSLTPTITISYGATISPAPVNDAYTEMDFTQPQTFVVTSDDGEEQTTYTVTVTEALQKFSVTFAVLDEDENTLQNAIITLGANTNEENDYVFDGLVAGDYDYTVTLTGYATEEGTITIVNEDVNEVVVLSKTYSVTFNVNMIAAEDFKPNEDKVYLTGNFVDWAVPGTEGSFEMELVTGSKNPPFNFSDSFEEYDDFVVNPNPWITWSQYDVRNYGMTGVSFPNDDQPYVMLIMNPNETEPPIVDTNPAYDGDKYAIVTVKTGNPTLDNKWVITPKLSFNGTSQLSFWGRSITDQYGLERIKVMVSTSGSDPDDFTKISEGNYLEVPVEWTEYIFDLSDFAGETGYVAINYVSDDSFMFMLDNFKVTAIEEGDDLIYTATIQLKAGEYEYKFFMNEGWGGGEWDGDEYPNRKDIVEEDMVINCIWGQYPNSIPEELLGNISVYPNPFNEHITIENAESVSRIVIANIIGQIVMDKQMKDASISLSTSALDKGLYLVTFVATNGQSYTFKMIKQ